MQSIFTKHRFRANAFARRPEENSLIGYINALFPQRDLKLIVAMGAPATRFVLRHRAELFPSAPLLIASSDVRTFSDLTLGNNDTACATFYDPTVQIDTILRLLPDTKDILVATGAAPNGDFWTNLLRRSFERYAPRVTFHWFSGLTTDEMLKRIESLPPRSAIFYVSVNSDARGAPMEGDFVLLRSLGIGRAPVFTHVDSHFGRGIVRRPDVFVAGNRREVCRRRGATPPWRKRRRHQGAAHRTRRAYVRLAPASTLAHQ
jgi:hypothetical protein